MHDITARFPAPARLPVHPYAEIFPLMDAATFAKFKANIKEHGQKVDILLYEEQLLDGRMREAACLELGIRPLYALAEAKDDAAALDLVMSLNEHRRHLSDEQRAFAAARYATLRQGNPIGDTPLTKAEKQARYRARGKALPNISKEMFGNAKAEPVGVSVKVAAKRFGTSVPSIARAKKILKTGDKSLEQAVVGKQVSLTAAAERLPATRPSGHAKPGRKKKAGAVSAAPVSRVPKVMPLRQLTPEQVDPELWARSPQLFTMKYGQTLTKTKAQLEAYEDEIARVNWVTTLRETAERADALTTMPSEAARRAWTGKSGPRGATNAAKLEAWQASLLRLLESTGFLTRELVTA